MTTAVKQRRPVARRVRRGGFLALTGLVLWGLLGLPYIVFPSTDPLPEHADAVVVLGPPNPQRVAVAERLLAERRVGTVLLSMPFETVPQRWTAVCARPDVTCADPTPRTTRGEARMLSEHAAEHGWSSVVVVTMTAHITRARGLIERCFDGTVAMESSHESPYKGWLFQYVYQTGATVKSWFLPGC